MAFSLFGSAFTDNVTVVTAAFLNYLRTSISQAIDGTGGGSYAPSSTIDIGGQGLGDSNLRGALTVVGSGGIFARFRDETATSGSVSITEADDVVRFTGTITGDVTITLPTDIAEGRIIYVVGATPGSSAFDLNFRYEKSDTTFQALATIQGGADGLVGFVSTGNDTNHEWVVFQANAAVTSIYTG